MRYHLLILILVVLPCALSAQRANRQRAEEYAREAREAYRATDYHRAIEYFEKAMINDRRNLDYQLELAKSYFGNREYNQAVRIVKPLSRSRKAKGPEQIEAIRLHVSCLDLLERQRQAIKTLQYGLKNYPNSGELYFEYGLVLLGNGDAVGALERFEEGILTEPGFARNYMMAARILRGLGNYGWAMLYAEQYLNIDRRTEFASEMSKFLYETYRLASPCGVEGCHFNFYKSKAGEEMAGLGGEFQQELGQLYSLALPESEKEFSPRLLLLVQLEVLGLKDPGEIAPSTQAYLKWIDLVRKKGHLEAYNYWLMQNGAPLEFGKWVEDHQSEFKDFESWYFKRSFLTFNHGPIVRPQVLNKLGK